MITYSNPRLEAVIADWPIGRNRTTATFRIERDPKRGERAVRTTVGKPKTLTYAVKARIVDGDDGKTYIAELGLGGGMISIMQGDMKYQKEVIHQFDASTDWKETTERFKQVLALFDQHCVWCKAPVDDGDEGDIVDGAVLCRECANKEQGK